jgi:hypothetical protein
MSSTLEGTYTKGMPAQESLWRGALIDDKYATVTFFSDGKWNYVYDYKNESESGSGEIYGWTVHVEATGTYAPVGENAHELTTTEVKGDGVVQDDLPGPFVVRTTGEKELRVRVFVQSNQHTTCDLLEGEEPQNHYNDKYVWRTMKRQTLEFPGFEYPGTMVKLGPGQYFDS